MYDFTCNNAWQLLAKRGTLRKDDLKRVVTGTFDGQPAWSNGFFLEVCEVPATIAKKAETTTALDNDMAMLRKGRAPHTAFDAIYWEVEANDPGGCILTNEVGDAWNFVQIRFVGYFLKKYKNVRFMLHADETGAIEVFAKDTFVGLIMPIHLENIQNESMQEMLIDYNLPNECRCNKAAETMQYHAGASCPITLAPAPAMHGPAYVPPIVPPPGYMMPNGRHLDATALWHAYCDMLARNRARDEADAIADAKIAAITGEEYAPPVDEPTKETKEPAPIFTPAVGMFVHLLYTHEDGRTTERVVNVKSVLHLSDGYFRGFDVRYQRMRNYHLSCIQWMRQWDRMAITDLRGRLIIPAYASEVARTA